MSKNSGELTMEAEERNAEKLSMHIYVLPNLNNHQYMKKVKVEFII